jgi:hypothetical protein
MTDKQAGNEHQIDLSKVRWFENAMVLAHSDKYRVGIFNYLLGDKDVDYSASASDEFDKDKLPKTFLYNNDGMIRGRIFKWGKFKYCLVIYCDDIPKHLDRDDTIKEIVDKVLEVSGICRFDFIVDTSGYEIWKN